MKMKIKVEIEGEIYQGPAILNIPELVTRQFDPLATTDYFDMAVNSDEFMIDSIEAKAIIKCREDAAKILAKEIANYLVKDMSKLDTHNGYSKKDQ